MNDETTVAARQSALFAALADADLDRLDGLVDEDAFIVHTDGVCDTKATFLDAVASGRAAFGPASLVHNRVVVADDGSGAATISVVDVRIRDAAGDDRVVRLNQVIEWREVAGTLRLRAMQSAKQPL